MDYEKIIVELIAHFIEHEGTDYLRKEKGAPESSFNELSEAERAKLGELRDRARTKAGWVGY